MSSGSLTLKLWLTLGSLWASWRSEVRGWSQCGALNWVQTRPALRALQEVWNSSTMPVRPHTAHRGHVTCVCSHDVLIAYREETDMTVPPASFRQDKRFMDLTEFNRPELKKGVLSQKLKLKIAQITCSHQQGKNQFYRLIQSERPVLSEVIKK